MQVDVTVRCGGRDLDVALVGRPSDRLDAVRPILDGVASRECTPAYVDGVLLPDSATLAHIAPGAVVSDAPGCTTEPGSALRELTVVCGPDSGRSLPLTAGSVVVGRSAGCGLRLTDPDVSRRHARLTVGVDGVRVSDLGSTNGTTIDGDPAMNAVLEDRSYLRMGDSVLALRPAGSRRATPPAGPQPAEVVQRPAAPESEPRRTNWASVAGPLIVGALFAVIVRQAMVVAFALMSPVVSLAAILGDRRNARRVHRARHQKYVLERTRADRSIVDALRSELIRRRDDRPDPRSLLDAVHDRGSWDVGAEQRWTVRVGLGEQASYLQARTGTGAAEPAGSLSLVPVCIDLSAQSVGVVGPRPARTALARWLIAQLAAQADPAQLRIVAPDDPAVRADWHWMRWLPHLGDGDAATQTVVVVDGDADDNHHRGSAHTLLHVAATADDLPPNCTYVIGPQGDGSNRVRVEGPGTTARDVIADRVTLSWCDQFARALARSADRGRTRSEPPVTCTLADIHGNDAFDVEAISAAWDRDSGSADFVLGADAAGPARLDLAAEGPHALVAGTTGSGKSELLRTMVVSLALGHPPDAVAFVLIDYKGGAAFAACENLPHVVGVLTDLDAALTARALTSLNAEIRRRERMLSSAGVADIAAYRAATGGRDLARLVLVVDEFATLVAELPDFVTGLVDIARRGRSLGIHLVLATQRPGGVVSAEIRANTSLRIALRTADVTESVDVVDSKDAALITPSTPGRAVVRTAATTRSVQVASGSGEKLSQLRVEPLGPWRSLSARRNDVVPGRNELDLAVLAIAAAAQRSDRTRAQSPWLPPLPSTLGPWIADGLRAPLALVDRPSAQRQERLELDLARGAAVVIAGAASTGRTASLVALAEYAAMRVPADQLLLCVVDPAGAWRTVELAHCCARVAPDSPDTIGDVVERVLSRSDGTLALVLIDGWDTIAAASDASDGGRTADDVVRLLRTAGTNGLTVVLSGERGALLPRISSAATELFALRLPDPGDYAMIGVAARHVPAHLPPGRAVRRDGSIAQLVASESVVPSALRYPAAPLSPDDPICGYR